MGVSSTLNLPAWGSDLNNPSTVGEVSRVLFKYAPQLRGITAYPDGARGGQPLTVVEYKEALNHKGVIFDETEERCGGDGLCGV